MAAILVKKLKALEADTVIVRTDSFLCLNIPEVKELSNLAETHLITRNGQCNWDEIQTLEDAGYRVFAVEQDRYSWLLGAIHTKKGIITYG